MSRSQRNKHYKKNWRESKNTFHEEKRIKLSKSTNRREEFNDYVKEFGGLNEEEIESEEFYDN